ncbi:3-oxoacyl-(acyl-carrier-protein) synthase III [Denitrovibrio acetiphilus DSM 12809]|uniref:Beta-ketoacyl-[acyl-carrier-protein] synthase III n=1 Tax=Denitrovibrio acetiphilus (strain DSM 12809 / NBRC 114555 / N2460) TaxID=522772 RepID=D4H755_DENA2|nr:beta-ketoacyl-ACP synthase III [Denitrovibrio acetiphilus]ADD69759.1 3-oxoacyl-(acyl-carrier-protein) synthase III [Denitrovibrio acetiphilus DSM 12809]
MNIFSRIIGTGSYFPEKIMTNKDFEKFLDTSDEWIKTRTGMKERRVAGAGEYTSDMGAKAALAAIEMAGINPEELDGIIVATFTPDTTMPSTACRIQHKIKAGNGFAFDLSAACSGFLYACSLANGLIKSGSAKKILIVGAENLTASLDWRDRGTCILFGDGAGAVVLSADAEPGIHSVHTYADGQYGELLKQDNIGTKFLRDLKDEPIEDNMIKMKGNDIFKIAVRAMADAAKEAADAAGFAPEDIDWVIPHQANMRIIDAVAKRLGVSMDNVVINIEQYANTSAATIPTALDQYVREGKIKKGDNVVSAAFGGGLTWGSMSFTF